MLNQICRENHMRLHRGDALPHFLKVSWGSCNMPVQFSSGSSTRKDEFRHSAMPVRTEDLYSYLMSGPSRITKPLNLLPLNLTPQCSREARSLVIHQGILRTKFLCQCLNYGAAHQATRSTWLETTLCYKANDAAEHASMSMLCWPLNMQYRLVWLCL